MCSGYMPVSLRLFKVYYLIHDFGAEVHLCWASQVLLMVKNPPTSVGETRDAGSISGLGRPPGGGHGNPLQDSWASLAAHRVQNLPAMRETQVQSLGWEGPLEKGMLTHSSILAWRIPTDRGAWQATVHGVAKSRTRRSDLDSLTPSRARAGGVFTTEPPGRRLSRALCWVKGTPLAHGPEVSASTGSCLSPSPARGGLHSRFPPPASTVFLSTPLLPPSPDGPPPRGSE